MTVTVKKGIASGRVALPPSKSILHRLLIGAALACGEESRVAPFYPCDDILATLDSLAALGAGIRREDSALFIRGFDPEKREKAVTLPCRESASTLRFLLPLCLFGAEATLSGTASLLSRPTEEYEALLSEIKGTFFRTDTSFTVCGRLAGRTYEIDASRSSQFVTGLLFALPLLGKDSRLILGEPIVSMPYIQLTLDVLKRFGIKAGWESGNTLYVPGNQKYRAGCFTAEPDASTAAFFEALPYLGASAVQTDLPAASLQADSRFRACFPLLADGAPTLDMTDCPDLTPICAVLAAVRNGAVLTGTKRLLYKESDRARAMKTELEKCGADITVEENRILIRPAPLHSPQETLFSHGDHRIAMALGILLTALGGRIEDAEAVGKSAPDFWKILSSLGIALEEIS